jgi:hypothetical protein
MMMPDSLGGGKMLTNRGSVLHRVEGIDELIPEEFLERRSYERTALPKIHESLKGKVIIQNEEQVLEEARRGTDGLVFWTDGSRREDEYVGIAVVWGKDMK